MPKPSSAVVARRGDVFNDLLGLFPPGHLVDLGAGHGSFSRRAADAGWKVTAVDARADRWPEDDRIDWVQSDVRDVELASFDLILCLGLFYHLTERDQLELLARASGRPMIIDTHLDHGTHRHELSDRMTTDAGHQGRWYTEPGALTSSWGNDASFWPTLDSFHRMLAAHGYRTVLTVDPWVISDRTFFVAAPRSSATR